MLDFFKLLFSNIISYIQNNFIDCISLLAYIIAGIFALIQWKDSNKNRRIEYIDKILKETHNNDAIKNVIEVNDYEKRDWYCDEFHRSEKAEDILFTQQTDETLSHLNFLCFLVQSKTIKPDEAILFEYNIKTMASNINTKRYMFDLYQYCYFTKREFPFPCFLKYCIDNQYITPKVYSNTFFKTIMEKESKNSPISPNDKKTYLEICNTLNIDIENYSIEQLPVYIKTCNRCDYCKNSNCKKKDKEFWIKNGNKKCEDFKFNIERWNSKFSTKK